jgi:hypothetical protein
MSPQTRELRRTNVVETCLKVLKADGMLV